MYDHASLSYHSFPMRILVFGLGLYGPHSKSSPFAYIKIIRPNNNVGHSSSSSRFNQCYACVHDNANKILSPAGLNNYYSACCRSLYKTLLRQTPFK